MNFFQDIITYYRAVEVSDLTLTRAGASARQSVDKRFGGGRREDPVKAARNMTLNISFTLLAYTSIPHQELEKQAKAPKEEDTQDDSENG